MIYGWRADFSRVLSVQSWLGTIFHHIRDRWIEFQTFPTQTEGDQLRQKIWGGWKKINHGFVENWRIYFLNPEQKFRLVCSNFRIKSTHLLCPTLITRKDSMISQDHEYIDTPPRKKNKRGKKGKTRARSFLSPMDISNMTRCFQEALPLRQISRILDVSFSCVVKRKQFYDQFEKCPLPTKPGPSTILSDELLSEIEFLCEFLPSPTARDIVSYLSPEHQCGLSTVRSALKHLNYSFKRVVSVWGLFSSSFPPNHGWCPSRFQIDATKCRRKKRGLNLC